MDEEAPIGPPTPTPPATPSGRAPTWRQIALGAIVFVATLVILVGLTGIPGRAPVATDTAGSAAIATATPSMVSTPPSSSPTDVPVSSTPTASPSAAPSASASASPTVAPSGDPVLVGAGDIASCGSEADDATAALLDDIDGTIFTVGDNVYDSATKAKLHDCYGPSWGRHKARTRPAAGNHDWQDGIGPYRDYFGSALGPDGTTWYAYGLGTWRVIVLDSNCDDVDGCGPDSIQGQWLAAELAGSPARCTVAIFHHPRFSSGSEHGNDRDMDPFWRALYAAGVDVIVNGHDHDYERFAPQDPDAREDRVRGIREFVVGTGGIALRKFGEIRANSELRSTLDHGVLALTLHDGSYSWRFHAATTDFSDRGTAFCH